MRRKQSCPISIARFGSRRTISACSLAVILAPFPGARGLPSNSIPKRFLPASLRSCWNAARILLPPSDRWRPPTQTSAAGSISQPIFTGGKLRNNLKLAEETKQEMVLTYQQTIAAAFRDVSNALISCQKSKEDRIAQEKEVTAAGESVSLARIRYDNGRSSYLEVLTNDTNFFAAELNLAGAQQQEALSLVQLYGALGGGWR